MIFTACDFLKWLRVTHHETQKQMADRLQVGTYMIRNRESGQTKIDQTFSQKVIDTYGLIGVPEKLLRKLTQTQVVELTKKEEMILGNFIVDYERSTKIMNKKEITQVMAEVGCPLAQGTHPTGGMQETVKSKNVIDLRDAARGYNENMDWRTWVDFMLAAYMMKQGAYQSRTALMKRVFCAAAGYMPAYPGMIYQRDKEFRAKVKEILVRMVRDNEIVFSTDTETTRAIAAVKGVPLYVATRMVYDKMLTTMEWTRLKLKYLEERGAEHVDRRILVSQDPDLVELFHDTSRRMLEDSRYVCPILHEMSTPIAL